MSALLLPLEEENANATVCNGDVSVSGSIEMENDVQEKTGLAGNSNQASRFLIFHLVKCFGVTNINSD